MLTSIVHRIRALIDAVCSKIKFIIVTLTTSSVRSSTYTFNYLISIKTFSTSSLITLQTIPITFNTNLIFNDGIIILIIGIWTFRVTRIIMEDHTIGTFRTNKFIVSAFLA